jgi:hypothetical protein
MRRRRHAREAEVDPFYDMLFNMLIAFVFCFIIALLAMNPKALKAGDVPAKAEYIVTLSWPDFNPNDIDLWSQGPSGDIVWFRSREAGLMHLDRDDRGVSNDTIMVNGKAVINPLNQEVLTIRGVTPGEYIFNAHYYESKDVDTATPQLGQPVDLTISVIKVNPKAEVVFYGQQTMSKRGQEVTLVRFHLDADGAVSDINTTPTSIVRPF